MNVRPDVWRKIVYLIVVVQLVSEPEVVGRKVKSDGYYLLDYLSYNLSVQDYFDQCVGMIERNGLVETKIVNGIAAQSATVIVIVIWVVYRIVIESDFGSNVVLLIAVP